MPINSVTPHPTRRTRLLVQTRKSQLMCLDHRMQHFSTRYVGHRCESYHVRAAYSPDGRFVVAGSEDGCFYAWSEETGDLLIDGMTVGFSGPLLQISWSSQQHVMALCGYGPDNPALIYYFDKDVAAENPSPLPPSPRSAAAPHSPGAGQPRRWCMAGALGTATRTAVDAAARAEKREGAGSPRRPERQPVRRAQCRRGWRRRRCRRQCGRRWWRRRKPPSTAAAANAAAANAAATPDRRRWPRRHGRSRTRRHPPAQVENRERGMPLRRTLRRARERGPSALVNARRRRGGSRCAGARYSGHWRLGGHVA